MPSEEAPPALYSHACAVYQKMYEQSTRKQADGITEMVVYEGMLTKLVTDPDSLNLPVPYYTRIRAKLLGMGCIRQLKRGGGTAPSQWELIREPNFDDWVAAEEVIVSPYQAQLDHLIAQVQEWGRHISRIEKALGLLDIPLPKE